MSFKAVARRARCGPPQFLCATCTPRARLYAVMRTAASLNPKRSRCTRISRRSPVDVIDARRFRTALQYDILLIRADGYRGRTCHYWWLQMIRRAAASAGTSRRAILKPQRNFSVTAEECAEQVSYSLSAAEDRVSVVLSSTRANASMTCSHSNAPSTLDLLHIAQ